ncbi:MAG TPA: metal-dependent hydrolase [Bryobacteraceae bacterium]|nr:metal-dependent hydrolase [Bryobacteraceae bacterium]
MENSTHTLTGLMLSRAGLNRCMPHAAPLLMMAANVPDLDIVWLLGGAETYFFHHRWITHAIAAAPVMALLPVFVLWLFVRKQLFFWRAYGLSLIAVASHLLLDWTNPYGIRLFLPFSTAWPKLEITGVFDIWISLVLFAAVLGPLLSGIVSSEIGAKSGGGRVSAILALTFLLLYDTGRYFLHERAIAVQNGRLYEGQPPKKISAMPDFFNPLVWRGIVETDTLFVVQNVHLVVDLDPTAGRIYYKPAIIPAMEAARSTRPFQELLNFSPFTLWRASPSGESDPTTKVEALDLRFGDPQDPMFMSTAIVDSANRVHRAWFQY